MNVNLYGHNNQWLMVDCGLAFDEPLIPGSTNKCDLVTADTRFIRERKEQMAGIIITHAHEDHVGALPYIWQQFNCPVYTTPFTAEILRRKFHGFNHTGLPIVEVKAGDTLNIGVFEVTWLYITHSLPEPNALLINTPAGNVFHTADWKIDKHPICGDPFDSKVFESLAEQQILAMVCDSTNALKPGYSPSENDCYKGLLANVQKAEGRVVSTCFASNIARLITLNRVAQKTGRYMALAGRSLENMVSAARLCGYWPEDCELYPLAHMGYLPREEVLVVATGSQGDEYAALARLAHGDHRQLELEAGDLVLFSSMLIPGNEPKVEKLVSKFHKRGVSTLFSEDSELTIHTSGHPCRQELMQMYQWVKPKIAIPVHGEAAHLLANAQVAKQTGVKSQMVGANGDLFKLAPQVNLQRAKVAVGRVAL